MRLLAFAAAALVAGCTSTSAPDPCGTCGAGTFCCVDRCLPFGSTCGVADGSVDAGLDAGGDAGADAGPADAGPDCGTPGCNPGYACIAWTDGTGAPRTSCLEAGSVPCDPSMQAPSCDGAVAVSCDAYADPDAGPPGLVHRNDCTATYGPDATCAVTSSGATCMGTPCDPATYASSCDAAMDDVLVWCDEASHFVRRGTCQADWRCVLNAWTRMDRPEGPACIPRVAVTSGAPATAALVPLHCDGATAIHVEQYGYEWSQACRTGESCFTFAASVGGDPARCLPSSTVTCDPAAFTAHCDAAMTSAMQCLLGVETPSYCGVGLVGGSIPSACDPTTGACVPTGFCSPAGSPPRCTADGRFRLTCNTDWIREIAEACTCTVDSTGAAVCG